MQPTTTSKTVGEISRAAAVAGLALAAAGFSWHLRPAPPTAAAGGAEDAIVAGCAWLAWILIDYLLFATVTCSAGRIVGATRWPVRALDPLAPRPLRHLVDRLISVGVAGAVLGSSAVAVAGPAATVQPIHRPSRLAVAPGELDWPGLTPPAAHRVAPDKQHHRPARPPARVDASPPTGRHDRVVVAPGDSLWSIAARGLGQGASNAATASAWHRWYAANREVIGPDPDLIYPGERLHPPASPTGAGR
jgi:nucleoid-associated protein YgaU